MEYEIKKADFGFNYSDFNFAHCMASIKHKRPIWKNWLKFRYWGSDFLFVSVCAKDFVSFKSNVICHIWWNVDKTKLQRIQFV